MAWQPHAADPAAARRGTSAEERRLQSELTEVTRQLEQRDAELKKEQGYRLANKLTQKHIDYSKNKMNVRLAAQVKT